MQAFSSDAVPKTLDKAGRSAYNMAMEAVEVAIGELIKSHPQFLRLCQWFRWGKIEIVVKDGKPVMISVRRDIKLD